MKSAYGGVVVSEGRVLLRQPAGLFDGYVWTFAKGRPDPGEEPESAACREVREECGVEVEILGEIPGSFDGGTTSNRYYLMKPVREGLGHDGETSEVRWVTLADAPGMIGQTTNAVGRARDLAVLNAAIALLAEQE